MINIRHVSTLVFYPIDTQGYSHSDWSMIILRAPTLVFARSMNGLAGRSVAMLHSVSYLYSAKVYFAIVIVIHVQFT